MLGRLARGLVLAGGAYLAFVGVLFVAQRSLLYPAPDNVASAAEAGLAGFEDVTLETADDERIRAYFRPPEPGRALVVYFHGNAGSIRQRAPRAAALAEGGRGVLITSYRGYSGSTGSPTEEGLIEDARAAYAFASRHAPAERIVLYGESLGTGVAVALATEVEAGAVVLDAPFTSAADVARLRYPFVPVGLLMRDQFDSAARIGAVDEPLLVMHGTQDRVTPFAQGRALYEAAGEPKRFRGFEAEGHTRLLENGGLAEVRALLDAVEAGRAAALLEEDRS
ncbi:alpha/beta hydrolase [Salinarimonas ramus]|uniref:Alpha/beta hydrolase n=1 Tax=Salinarimonas ramus TaxID=690164 RepID=A0A917V2D4_9HYPH|nr:alpha/beta fold hydrolase [Salinarimonas ramus]GGK22815.1 alpha/beta hydrolase [Salinarimonas ramus]